MCAIERAARQSERFLPWFLIICVTIRESLYESHGSICCFRKGQLLYQNCQYNFLGTQFAASDSPPRQILGPPLNGRQPYLRSELDSYVGKDIRNLEILDAYPSRPQILPSVRHEIMRVFPIYEFLAVRCLYIVADRGTVRYKYRSRTIRTSTDGKCYIDLGGSCVERDGGEQAKSRVMLIGITVILSQCRNLPSFRQYCRESRSFD